MSKQHVDFKMINYIDDKWDEQECQDLLEAMKVELKSDLRKRKHPGYSDENIEQLINNMQNRDFWAQLHLLFNDFGFEY
jgi:arsenate reductase-like glutaredoxin family protein